MARESLNTGRRKQSADEMQMLTAHKKGASDGLGLTPLGAGRGKSQPPAALGSVPGYTHPPSSDRLAGIDQRCQLLFKKRARWSLNEQGTGRIRRTREPMLADFQDEPIGAFLNSFVERGLSPISANSHRNNLICLWRFGARRLFVEEFPEVPSLVEPIRIPQGSCARGAR
jgi:hypothetical protein